MDSQAFLQASAKVSRARATLRTWNRKNPDRIVAWEWVEEAVIAKIRSAALAHRRPNDAADQLARHQEFRAKLPADLIGTLFPEGEERSSLRDLSDERSDHRPWEQH